MNMWFTVQELTACHSFPNTERGGRKFLDKIVKDKPDIKRKRQGTKAFEYAFSGLPEQIQNELCHRYSVSIVKAKPKSLPADLRQVELKTLTEKQREVAGARMALVAQVAQLEQAQPRYKAIKFFCEQIKHGGISSDLMRLVETANNKKGKNRTLSDRTLNQWVLDYEKADTPEERLKALAPMQRVAKKAEEIV